MYSINFRLRPDSKTDEKRVYIRFRKDGIVPSDISTPIVIPPEKWDKHKQTIKGSSVLDSTKKAVLLQIESDLTELIRQNVHKDAHEIRAMYINKTLPAPTIFKTYHDYIEQNINIWDNTPKQLAKTTKSRWKNCLQHLKEFLNEKDITLNEIDESFGHRLYVYLIKKPKKKHPAEKIGNDYAVRVITYLKDVLEWAKKKKLVDQVVMNTDGLKRVPPKQLQRLDKEHIESLASMRFTKTLEDTRVIFLLMTYSCLNHCDLHNLESLKDKSHLTINLDRQKNNNREAAEKAIIPVLPQLRKLLENINYKIPRHHINIINRHCHVFQGILGVDFEMTTYTARKTGAGLLIDAGVSIDIVSKILGHKSITTTQRFYVKLREKNVLEGVKHLMKTE